MFLQKETFATSCWEKEGRLLLEHPNYLEELQIGNHLFAFAEKLLIINNVVDPERVQEKAYLKVQEKVLTRVLFAEEMAGELFSFFKLKRSDFTLGADAKNYEGVHSDWVYYNALAPLSAIYACRSEYLLYLTGDVYVPR